MEAYRHPSYIRVRDELVSTLRTRFAQTRRVNSIIFLCGGASSVVRPFLRSYFGAHHPDWLVFYADDVWDHVEAIGTFNALDMERELAALADVVVIVVESPGTFAELGAFAMQDDLRDKLVVILDEKYETDRSFINTGPVRWVDESEGECIYCPFDSAGLSVSRLVRALNQRLPQSRFDSLVPAELGRSSRHLLLLLGDLVAVMGPVSPREIRLALQGVTGGELAWRPDTFIGLALSLGIIKRMSAHGSSKSWLFYRPLDSPSRQGLLLRDSFDIRKARAKFIECYQRLPGEWDARFPLPTATT